MEGTGGTSAPKGEKTGNSIPKDNYRFIPAISEQGLGEKPQKKKLQMLFDYYLKPQQNESKTLDIQKQWGQKFKEGMASCSKKDLQDQQNFVIDVMIYYLYYDIVFDRQKYPKSVPLVDFPIEMIEFLIKKAQKVFEEEKPLIQFEAPVKIFGDIHGQFSDLLHMFKEMSEKNKQEQGDQIVPRNSRLLFMGDYVNRGK